MGWSSQEALRVLVVHCLIPSDHSIFVNQTPLLSDVSEISNELQRKETDDINFAETDKYFNLLKLYNLSAVNVHEISDVPPLLVQSIQVVLSSTFPSVLLQ